MGRQKGWNADENLLACRAWVIASEDPINGTSQNADSFVDSIARTFHNLVGERMQLVPTWRPNAHRSGNAILKHFKKIRHAVMKFESKMQLVRAAKPTGEPSQKDLVRVATGMYNKKTALSDMYRIISADPLVDIGAQFEFLSCWQFFKSTQLFRLLALATQEQPAESVLQSTHALTSPAEVVENRNSTHVNSAPSAEHALSSATADPPAPQRSTTLSRPIGAKKAIEKARKERAHEVSARGIARIAEMSAKKAEVASSMLQIEEAKHCLSIMSLPEVDPNLKKQYIQLLQQQALEKMRRSMQASMSTSPVISENVSLPTLRLVTRERSNSDVPVVPVPNNTASLRINVTDPECPSSVDTPHFPPYENSATSILVPMSASNIEDSYRRSDVRASPDPRDDIQFRSIYREPNAATERDARPASQEIAHTNSIAGLCERTSAQASRSGDFTAENQPALMACGELHGRAPLRNTHSLTHARSTASGAQNVQNQNLLSVYDLCNQN